MKSTEVTIRIADLPEVTDLIKTAATTIERLTRERDEAEQRYESLLASVGGVWPG